MTMTSVLNRASFGTPVDVVKLKVLVRAKHIDMDKAFMYVDAIRAAQAMASFAWYFTREEFLACGDAEDPTLKTIEVELVVDENLDWLVAHKEKLAWEYYGFPAELRKDSFDTYHLLPFGRK